MREPNGHALLQPLGEVLSLAVSLPTAERSQRAISDVTLRLAVTNEADLDRGGDALAEPTGELPEETRSPWRTPRCDRAVP